MSDAYLVDGVRTPVGRYGGALAGIRPDDLAALVVGEVVARAGVPADAFRDPASVISAVERSQILVWFCRLRWPES